MLLKDFFTIHELRVEHNEATAVLEINAHHPLFEGHFPGQPVVPGVCMMQMIKELLEEVTGKPTNLSLAHEMKFLAVIDPLQNNRVQATLKYQQTDEGKLLLNASLANGELLHYKFKGLFDFQ